MDAVRHSVNRLAPVARLILPCRLILAVAWLLTAAGAAAALERRTVEVAGRARDYLTVAPAQADRPLPLVLLFHGAGGDAAHALAHYRWDEWALRRGFIVAALNALPADPDRPADFVKNPRYWNAGGGNRRPNADDIAFARTVIDDAIAAKTANPARIFATGFSSGAAMTLALGAAMPDRLLAIAAVAGHVTPPAVPPPGGPSLLYVTGTEDPLNPIQGGEVAIGFWGARIPKAPPYDVVDAWAEGLGCATDFDSRPNPDTRLINWVECPGKRHVRYYELLNFGHYWPGATAGRLPAGIAGPWRETLDATDLIWTFFSER